MHGNQSHINVFIQTHKGICLYAITRHAISDVSFLVRTFFYIIIDEIPTAKWGQTNFSEKGHFFFSCSHQILLSTPQSFSTKLMSMKSSQLGLLIVLIIIIINNKSQGKSSIFRL